MAKKKPLLTDEQWDLIEPLLPQPKGGRKLRRYRRRWIIERTIACLGNFRCLVVGWGSDINIYRAFFHVACILIAMRQF